uniref:Uncharacterized protein n=1 Tax=Magallana gigas TaxID=29159 RepID=K1QIK6_MAGGI
MRKPNRATFSAIERVRTVNHKLRESLDSERYSLLESADQKSPIFENMQLELESEHAKVKDLKNSVEREKQRVQSQVTVLECQTCVLKDELEQERLACCQMKNEIDQIQDAMNENEGNSDTEEVTERRTQRQLERERDDQKMKMVMMCSQCLDTNYVGSLFCDHAVLYQNVRIPVPNILTNAHEQLMRST